MRRPTTTSRRNATLAVSLLAGLLIALSSSTAYAAFSHTTVEKTFPLGAPCAGVNDIAVLEAEGLVYVSCEVNQTPNTRGDDVIKRFDLLGNPVPFSATGTAPYINGNTLTGDPASTDGTLDVNFGPTPQLAVDNSASSNHGKLFVISEPSIDVFEPSGEYSTSILQPGNVNLADVDVGPDGSIYAAKGTNGSPISKYNPAFQEVKRFYGNGSFGSEEYGTASHIRIDSTGAVWASHAGINVFSRRLDKFEADQFTDQTQFTDATPQSQIAPYVAKGSPFSPHPLIDSATLQRFDVDLTDNDVYVDRGNLIETYSAGNAGESSYKNAPNFGGGGTLVNSKAIAVTEDHHVYAGSGPNVVLFGPGNILPDIHTTAIDNEEVGHTTATVRGKVELAGGANITGCKVEYGIGNFASTKTCEPDPAESPPGSNFAVTTPVKADLTGLSTGQLYQYRFQASNASGGNEGIMRTFTPPYVLNVQTLPAVSVTPGGATLKGSFKPDAPTTYLFEYGVTTSYGFSTPSENGGSGPGVATVGTPITGLPSGRTLHYRITATTGGNTTTGPDMTFRTASAPDTSGVHASQVTATSAVLEAKVNPVGYATEYQFEYGTTSQYDHVVPASKVPIGSGSTPALVSQKVEGLQEGITYHFRVVAVNEWGTGASSDTTFDYTPPACPNDHIRQQTGTGYLPDCRAYELVSPEGAGGVNIYPGGIINGFGETQDWPLNQGFATSPGRFGFFGGLGSVIGLRPPNATVDTYLSTRTQNGWVTAVPGLKAGETFDAGRMECSESMDLCVDHNDIGFFTRTLGGGENAPYLYTATGEPRGRLPTNLGAIPGGTRFKGEQRMSGDFGHFVFSSTNLPFTPDGVLSELGSAYDNDIRKQTVTVVSKLPNGENLLQELTPSASITFPGLSPNGSHILMQTPAAGGLAHLFMRVNQSVTYDISRGVGVKPIGMTRTGDSVLFVTKASLTAGDTDTSADLYRWSESGAVQPDELTLLSTGNGQGNTDACSSSYGSAACDIEVVAPEKAHPVNNTKATVPGQDDIFAEVAGDVYFYSPELLDPARPGIKNQRNLYVVHNGAVQLVTTLDAGKKVDRIQISPDGAKAAFFTGSRLTSYDNGGFREVYTYDADTGVVRCASCKPDGSLPTIDVQVSQGGRFMADDGRVFFSTADVLVPTDTDGKIIDTYEYVGGRPQLISSGQGSRDTTGGGFTIPVLRIGLEAVSHDGQDVYFSTFETLLDRDHNGEFVKFYDARTAGGFPEDPDLGPCGAADECHGVDSSAPQPPGLATGGDLGSGGNVASAKHKKKKKRRHRGGSKPRHSSRHGSVRHD